MTPYAVMLRGINVGAARRISMAQLRELLTSAGCAHVATHGQSGNVVLAGAWSPEDLAATVAKLISDRFGFAVPVTVRGGEELTAVVAHDPLDGAATDPKRYQVTFLDAAPAPEALATLRALMSPEERLAVHGRELYSHHPVGIARSKLAARLTHQSLGPTATVRNWSTVLALGELVASGW